MDVNSALIITNIIVALMTPILVTVQILIKSMKRSKCCNSEFEAQTPTEK